MAYDESTRAVTAISGSAISVSRFVVFAADGAVDHAGTAQMVVDGISAMEIPTADIGETVPINVPDGTIAMIELGATLSAAALVATDNVGRAVAHGATAGNVCMGKLVKGGALGDIVPMFFAHKLTAAGS